MQNGLHERVVRGHADRGHKTGKCPVSSKNPRPFIHEIKVVPIEQYTCHICNEHMVGHDDVQDHLGTHLLKLFNPEGIAPRLLLRLHRTSAAMIFAATKEEGYWKPRGQPSTEGLQGSGPRPKSAGSRGEAGGVIYERRDRRTPNGPTVSTGTEHYHEREGRGEHASSSDAELRDLQARLELASVPEAMPSTILGALQADEGQAGPHWPSEELCTRGTGGGSNQTFKTKTTIALNAMIPLCLFVVV